MATASQILQFISSSSLFLQLPVFFLTNQNELTGLNDELFKLAEVLLKFCYREYINEECMIKSIGSLFIALINFDYMHYINRLLVLLSTPIAGKPLAKSYSKIFFLCPLSFDFTLSLIPLHSRERERESSQPYFWAAQPWLP